jgi:hypothetical protein
VNWKLHNFQSREIVKYSHEPHGTWNQEWLCQWGPAVIYPTLLNDKLKRIWKERLCPDWHIIPAFAWRAWRKPQRTSVGKASVLANQAPPKCMSRCYYNNMFSLLELLLCGCIVCSVAINLFVKEKVLMSSDLICKRMNVVHVWQLIWTGTDTESKLLCTSFMTSGDFVLLETCQWRNSSFSRILQSHTAWQCYSFSSNICSTLF